MAVRQQFCATGRWIEFSQDVGSIVAFSTIAVLWSRSDRVSIPNHAAVGQTSINLIQFGAIGGKSPQTAAGLRSGRRSPKIERVTLFRLSVVKPHVVDLELLEIKTHLRSWVTRRDRHEPGSLGSTPINLDNAKTSGMFLAVSTASPVTPCRIVSGNVDKMLTVWNAHSLQKSKSFWLLSESHPPPMPPAWFWAWRVER